MKDSAAKDYRLLSLTIGISLFFIWVGIIFGLVFDATIFIYLRRVVLLVGVMTAGAFLPDIPGFITAAIAVLSDGLGIGQQFTGGDLLFWVLLIAVVVVATKFEISSLVERFYPVKAAGQTPDSRPARHSGFSTGPAISSEVVDFEKIIDNSRQLIIEQFNRGMEALNLTNLLYYHVRNRQAQIGYVINQLGEINRQLKFEPDIAQSVGWVLRHEKPLKMHGRTLDWRNLRYHVRPVELRQVNYFPIKHEDQLVGVLVLEWDHSEIPQADQLQSFVDQINQIIRLDYGVRQLVKTQKKLRLLEKLYTVNPLQEKNFNQTVSRVLEFVKSYLPADEIDFFSADQSFEHISPPVRRKIFEGCRRWIINSGEILRVADLSRKKVSGQLLDRYGQSRATAFLGGQIAADGSEIAGLIFLTASNAGYFNREDEKIFRVLLDYLEQLLQIARGFDSAEQQSRRLKQWIERLCAIESCADPKRQASSFLTALQEELSPAATAYYWRNNGCFERVTYTGKGIFPEMVDVDSTLASSIVGTDEPLFNFPRTDKLPGFDLAENLAGPLVVLPVRGDDKKLNGFVTVIFSSSARIPEKRFDSFKQLAGLFNSWLRLDCFKQLYQQESALDNITELNNYASWRRQVEKSLQKKAAPAGVWQIWVPGFQEIGEAGGREELVSWTKSLAGLLSKRFPHHLICRSYGTVFCGFKLNPGDELEEQLNSVRTDISGWTFPEGDWPAPVRVEYQRIKPPYPLVDKLLESMHYFRTDSFKRLDRKTEKPVVEVDG